jgi:CRISPR/Cas system CMR subunit Cmr6 (Cas7 group RAMP superfamily)
MLVNFRTMLRRLMVELVKDQEEIAIVKEQESKVKMETALEQSKRIREEKKLAALERSKQRQSDPNYFQKITENNIKPVKEDSSPAGKEEDEEEEEVQKEVDPFQTFVPKGRSKIFIR